MFLETGGLKLLSWLHLRVIIYEIATKTSRGWRNVKGTFQNYFSHD